MSRFVLGNCIDVMARIPDNAIDFILTDPPYLVGFRDRQGRTIAGDKTDEWLQPACNEMYRVLKKDALMVSFYGWNRVDRFMSAWKNPTVAWCVKRRTGCATENLWISQIFSGEPDMYILRRDTPIMIVSYHGWSGSHAACPLHSPE